MSSKFNTAAPSKFAAKPSTVQARATKPRTVKDDSDAMRRYAESVAQAQDELLDAYDTPSSTRVMIATVSALLAYGVGVYWAAQAVNIAVIAVALLTGSAFLAFLVTFIGYAAAIIGSLRIGYSVGKFVLGYETGDFAKAGQSIKESATAKVSLVRGWFTRSDDAATATA